MKRVLKKVDYADLVSKKIVEDHRIGDDILLLDEFMVNPVNDHEFISTGNSFFEVLKGEGYVEINGHRFPVSGHSLIIYLQNQKIKASIKGPVTVQRAAYFSDNFMEMLYHDAPHTNEIRYSIMKNPVIPINETVSSSLEMYVQVLKNISSRPDYKTICAEYATLAFFYGPLQGILPKKINNEVCRSTIISSKFFKLLKDHFKTEHELSFYADKLKVSRQYLHISVLSASGKAPGYWIDEHLTKEAKKILLEPEHNITAVSQMLNFAGSKQFGRFFKKQTGTTPREYRKIHDRTTD